MRLKVTVSYDGSSYSGWQRQTNAPSIQNEIEVTLSTMLKQPVEVIASGRTDAQVHAIGQVFHFDCEKDIDEEQWIRALNSLLPKDIRIQSVERVDDNFHARFSATMKRYDYLVSNEVRNPFVQSYMGIERFQLDRDYMQECATVFIGTHDFTSFTSAKIDPRKPRVKTITRIEVQKEEKYIRIIFEGTGFLRYMVRMLAQTLIEAGKHQITKEEIRKMLESKDKHACRYKADPQGLYLVHVKYE